MTATARAVDRPASTGVSRHAVLAEPGLIELREVPAQTPGAGQVVVRVEGCGVCGSNLAPWKGAPWFDYPFPAGAPGHEAWGVVEAVGPGVHGIEAGARVTTLYDRAFADRFAVAATELVELPPELDGRPFPGEPLACAMNVFRRSGIAAGSTVAVVGVGFLGALLVQLASAAGARVVGLSRRAFARQVALECGADLTLSAEDAEAAVSGIGDWTGGSLCDVVIEATGRQAPLDLAARLVRVRGRLVIAGYHQDGPRRVDMQLWNWRGLDVINAHERETARYMEGIRAAVEATLDGRLNSDSLITHAFPLSRLGDALDTVRDRPDGFLKAVVTP